MSRALAELATTAAHARGASANDRDAARVAVEAAFAQLRATYVSRHDARLRKALALLERAHRTDTAARVALIEQADAIARAAHDRCGATSRATSELATILHFLHGGQPTWGVWWQISLFDMDLAYAAHIAAQTRTETARRAAAEAAERGRVAAERRQGFRILDGGKGSP